MATKTQFSCDICGKPKGETNHWFMGDADSDGISILPWDSAMQRIDAHLCGEQCAIKFLSNWMAEQQKASKV